MEKPLWSGSEPRSLCSRLARRSPTYMPGEDWLNEVLAEDRGAEVGYAFASPVAPVAETLELFYSAVTATGRTGTRPLWSASRGCTPTKLP